MSPVGPYYAGNVKVKVEETFTRVPLAVLVQPNVPAITGVHSLLPIKPVKKAILK